MMSSSVNKIIRGTNWRLLSRFYSTNTKLVSVTHNDNTGVSTLSMNRAPVNGLNLDLLTDLNETMKKIEKDGSSGMILTSSLPTVFSAGLDITEMYKPNSERLVKFWTALQDAWLTLYSMGLPTVAVINGSSPAGGCLFTLGCEYRIFVDGKHAMGLNETQLGIVAPFWFQEAFANTVGARRTELALMRGEQFRPQQALAIGLVDEVATDKANAIDKAEKYIGSYSEIPMAARAATKLIRRSSLIEKLTKNKKHDLENFTKNVVDPRAQASMGLYLEYLKSKK